MVSWRCHAMTRPTLRRSREPVLVLVSEPITALDAESLQRKDTILEGARQALRWTQGGQRLLMLGEVLGFSFLDLAHVYTKIAQ